MYSVIFDNKTHKISEFYSKNEEARRDFANNYG